MRDPDLTPVPAEPPTALQRLERAMPGLAVAGYVGGGLCALTAAAVVGGLIPRAAGLLLTFHYLVPAVALLAGGATALTPSPRPRVLRDMFWLTAGLFAIGPA